MLRLGPHEPVTRVGVTVTFLRMEMPPAQAAPLLPEGMSVVRLAAPTVAFYRYLYHTVGADYVWWLRRAMSDAELSALLAHPSVSIHVLYGGGEPAGFYELEVRPGGEINLGYFGLLPHAVGGGFGTAFLRQAVDTAWSMGARALTVNTCTADHPRALPGYQRVGFVAFRRVREIWDVPDRLGLHIPERLRV
jgi:GNAT superfamily N-acetyltransferase